MSGLFRNEMSMKIQKHIEIVRSDIPGFSQMGRKSSEMIRVLLLRHYQQVGISTLNSHYDLQNLVLARPDLVFLGMKQMPMAATPRRNIWLSEYLNTQGINYTGSGGRAMAAEFNKTIAKDVVKRAGLQTTRYFLSLAGQFACQTELPLPFPLFVKPQSGGGGKGIDGYSVVRNFTEFTNKVKMIVTKFGAPALVEEYLPGREFSVAILGNPTSADLTAMPVELVTNPNSRGDRILGQKVKADDNEHIIAVSDHHLRQELIDLAKKAFIAIGARDYGRIDIRLDAQGIPQFIEANLIPGVACHDFTSYFTSACWINQKKSYEAMILQIVELGLSHRPKNASRATFLPVLGKSFAVPIYETTAL